MRYFFYGTLMDVHVLSVVTGRRYRPSELAPARLVDWRCAAVLRARYPALVPAPGRICDGVVVDGIGRRMADRLGIYEGPEYRLEVLEVEAGDGPLAANVFLPRRSMPVDARDWSFETWRKRHKPGYMRRLTAPGWQAT